MNLSESSNRLRIYSGIFVTSAVVLMLEVILTRIFSVKLYYHFAFMVISLALLGAGASGVYVYLFPNFFTAPKLGKQLFWTSWLFALSIPLVLGAILQLDFQLNFTIHQLGRIFLLYAIPAIPFFLGGLCISLAVTHLAAHAGRLYCFDLAGAAAGCLLVIPLLNHLGGPQAMLATSLLATVSCWAWPFEHQKKRLLLPLLVALPTIAILVFFPSDRLLKIKYVKGKNEGEALFTKWNSFSRITVVQVNQDPKNTWIIMDGDAGTLLPFSQAHLAHGSFLKSKVSSLAYHLKENPKTLIIGPGGGIDVLTALAFGSQDITGVEINPITVNDVMKGKFVEFTGGLYQRPEVNIVVDEGRSFIRKTVAQYDIIEATLVDTWAATAAGAFALTENNLYTVEAFKDYIAKLKPDGILTFTRWNLEPPQQDLRLAALTLSAMREMGIPHPERAMMVIRESGKREARECNFMFKKSGFSDPEVAKIENTSLANSFEVLYTPSTQPSNPFTQLITASDPQHFYRQYPYDVSPPRDNSPFFFHTVRASQIWNSLFLSWESKKTNIGMLVLVLIFAIALVLVILFILLPLYRMRQNVLQAQGDFKAIAYFLCLGLGFILVEMTLIQKFILFLGRPVYALGVVLFSTLLFSGLGSLLSAAISAHCLPKTTGKICLLLAALIITYIFALPYFLYRFVALAVITKALMVVGFLMPLGFLMGMPLPLGIRRLNRTSTGLVPWAWGLNGSSSVLGSILTVLIAIYLGFNQALGLASTLYLLAAILTWKLPAGVELTNFPLRNHLSKAEGSLRLNR